LRRSGVSVHECHVPLWHGVDDRVQVASGGWKHPVFFARVLRAYWQLVRQHHALGDYDLMVLGYPGQVDVPLARILSWLRRKPLVLDLFMSIFLIAEERGLTAKHPVTGRLINRFEKWACHRPDMLIKDTPEYVDWCEQVFGLEPSRFRLVPTGADDRVYAPAPPPQTRDGGFRVLYYGTYIPNHGLPYIVDAARLLQDHTDLTFEMIGDGPLRPEIEAQVKEHSLENVIMEGWMDRAELATRVAAADLCLGAFGHTPQSMMTVHNKVYEALAMAKCVVAGDSPAMRSALVHGEQVWLCDRSKPESLAEAILTLKENPELRRSLARQGHTIFTERYSLDALGCRFRAHLEELLEPASGQPYRESRQPDQRGSRQETESSPGLRDGGLP
jgi:glycosyltransferase involved in cell wall biosynthesis